MSWWDALRTAVRALRANKLRSFLTMLGIIVGVASLITMVAVGSGAQTQIAEQIRSLGANVLMVQPGSGREGAARMGAGTRQTLTEGDTEAIAQLPVVFAASPSVRGQAQIVRGNRNWRTTVNGTTADMFLIREWVLSAGRYFSQSEEEGAGRVALIGMSVAEYLFGDGEPVGAEIRIANVPFQVIGVLAEKGPAGTGRDQDDIVFVPISTAKLRLLGTAGSVDREAVAYILVKVASEEAMQGAEAQMEALLRQRHRLTSNQENDFRITNPAAAMQVQNASARTFAWLLASIASVSLIVGGISIMNIMLVSVSERTREIGIRLAVGARRRDVRNQFLIEAMALCLFGGLIGLLAGVAAAVLVAQVAGWPVFVGLDAVVFAVGFAAAVGIFFGWYPAHKAAQLEPAEALRAE